jgi:hypothetical protein
MARKTKGIARTYRALRLAIKPILGVWSDSSIHRVYGIPLGTIARWRELDGKAPAPVDHAGNARTRGEALRKAVLDALWTRQGSRSGEVYERVVNNLGSVTQRQVIRVLMGLVGNAQVTKRLEGVPPLPMYRRVE